MPRITAQMINEAISPDGRTNTPAEQEAHALAFWAQQPEALKHLSVLVCHPAFTPEMATNMKTGFMIGVLCAQRAMEVAACTEIATADDEIAAMIVREQLRGKR